MCFFSIKMFKQLPKKRDLEGKCGNDGINAAS